jgi:outer membrane autotransporter protein
VNVTTGTLNLAQAGAFTTTGGYATGNGATTQVAANASLAVGGAFTQDSGSALNLALGNTQPIVAATTATLDGSLDITSFGASAPNTASALTATLFNVIRTTGGIANDFTSIHLGGASNPLDYLTLTGHKSANGLDYNVGFGLTWLAGATNGNGVFTLANGPDMFNVDVPLGDQPASSVPWDGRTLTKHGAGTLILSANNTYTGLTTVAAGTLVLNGAIAGDAQVDAGATLRGSGTVAGTSTIASGGHLAPGNSPGTLHTGNLVLSGGSVLDYELGVPNIAGGGSSDLTVVGSGLTLDGTLNIVDAGGFAGGVYRLFDYGGTLTDHGLVLGSLPTGFAADHLLVQTAIAGQVNLIVDANGFATQFWDGTDAAGNGAIGGGDGTWTTTPAQWTDANGKINAPWQSGFAVFQAQAGTVTLGENIAFTGMQFSTNGYVIAGNGHTLAADAATTIRTDAGVTATIDAAIVDGAGGAAQLTKTDGGVLILGGDNMYSGGTVVRGGTLQIATDGNLGAAAGALTIDGGTLRLTAPFDTARALSLGAGGATLEVTDRNKFTGPVNGAGPLIKTGSGALVFDTVANYTGLTHVVAGTLVVGDGSHANAQLMGGGGVRVDAAATFGGYGTVAGPVDNAGLLGVGNALPALASGADADFTIAGSLINTGTVTMVNDAAADHLRVTGAYVAHGGQLELEARLNEGGAATQADRLVVGSVERAGNPTGIVVHALGGDGALTQGDGIALIDVTNAAASAAGAFVLSGRVVEGPYEYRLFQGGIANPADGQWYLRTEAVPPTPEPTPPTPVPIYRPEVGAYLANREAVAGLFAQSLHDRQGDPQFADASADPDGALGKVWLRVQGGTVRSHAADGELAIDGGRTLFQLGGNLAQFGLADAHDQLYLGGMAGYTQANTRVTAQLDPAQAHGKTSGYVAGVYATWFADGDRQLGSYVDAWAQYGWFDNQVNGQLLPSVDYNARSWAASLEYGYGFALGQRWVLAPQVQVVHNDYHANHVLETNGTQVASLDDSDTLTRLGVRLYPQLHSDIALRPFVEINWWHGGGAHAFAFNGVAIADAVPDNRYQLNLGLQGQLGHGWIVSARVGEEWGKASYRHVEAQLAVKYSW